LRQAISEALAFAIAALRAAGSFGNEISAAASILASFSAAVFLWRPGGQIRCPAAHQSCPCRRRRSPGNFGMMFNVTLSELNFAEESPPQNRRRRILRRSMKAFQRPVDATTMFGS